MSTFDMVQRLIGLLKANPLSPFLYLIIFIIRPVIFFPISILIISAGYVFGPLMGSLYALSGGVISAMIAYLIGKYFGQNKINNSDKGIIKIYTEKLKANSFTSVLTMRFILLPHDFVSYLSGFLHINFFNFSIATLLGSLPGTLSYVFLGSTIKGDFSGQSIAPDPAILGISIVLFIVSIGISYFLKRNERLKQGI